MKDIFSIGDKKYFSRVIEPADTAAFDSGQVHPVYSTFALARDAEWTCRLFALDMKDDDEEGIGTMISVNHFSPAFPGDEIAFTASVKRITGNEIICNWEARKGERLIATGEQGQKILKKEKIENIFKSIR
jgi:fluoroacetyl-CoA thioesterase